MGHPLPPSLQKSFLFYKGLDKATAVKDACI